MAKKLLSCKSLSVFDKDLSILKDISFDVHEGEIITIIGPNGSGKTTLIKALCEIIDISEGSLTKKNNLKIGYVPQKMNADRIFPITVENFLNLQIQSKNIRDIEKINNIISQIGIEKLLRKQLSRLSGGEVQKIMLARAIKSEPELLILDEPLQGLDVVGQAEFYKLISKIKSELKCAIVMVSHDLHMVMASTDEVICINNHICCHGKPEDVSAHPEYINLFGSKNAQDVAVYTHKHDHSH